MTSWLFAFLVHSTLWLGLAWLSVRLFPGIHARLRETIWYTALAASLITPTVHTLTSPDTAVWRLPVPAVVAGGEHGSGPGHRDGEASGPVSAGGEVHRNEGGADAGWPTPAGILWAALAGGLLVLYLLRLEKLRRRLRDREPVTDPRASRALTALGARAALAAPPRLTESHNLGSPVALGVGTRREICVPVRALHELDEGELRALLGHEVAHHLRRDTIRLAVLNGLQAVFFVQPLLRLAVRELRMAAEELCDDWAANQFDDRFAMASCLTEVARWVVRGDRHTPVPCIGRRRSQLERRVRRLMSEHGSLRAPSRAWRRLSAVGLLALAPLVAPAVAPGTDLSHEDRRVLEGAEAGEHGQSREHELRERGEHGPAS
ncbi:MAG: M56 family metallopeptidase [Gemmatimonadetes bacterium]|nr:M56 family metallopeptidase [Gemmatimonadota bacterium]MYH53253.1 M56 family metallopeptidase [Gemmatimonadota bacterium]MYK66883.1 M56 family metallopeptidase [Gemmatimonadota bacterium]